MVEEAVSAPEPSTEAPLSSEEPPSTEDVESQPTPEVPVESGDGVEGIGEEVEWKEPDVLANEVEWDDEIELLD